MADSTWRGQVGEAGHSHSEGSQKPGKYQALPKIWQILCPKDSQPSVLVNNLMIWFRTDGHTFTSIVTCLLLYLLERSLATFFKSLENIYIFLHSGHRNLSSKNKKCTQWSVNENVYPKIICRVKILKIPKYKIIESENKSLFTNSRILY